MFQQSFFMVKPDGVARNLTDEIFRRVHATGLSLKECRMVNMAIEEAAQLYSPHLGKPFYEGLIKFITSSPVMCCIVEGEGAVEKLRRIMGATNPQEAVKGTIRADLQEENIRTEYGIIKNLVHGSDSFESAAREIAIFFNNK